MQKLLFLVNVDWFFLSHRLPIAIEAARRGYEVHIATEITGNIEVLRDYGFIVHPVKIGRSSTGIIGELRTFWHILQIFRTVRPDLVHLVTIKPVLYGGIAARLVKVPAVVSAISGLGFLFVERATLKTKLLRSLVLFLYRLAMGHPNQRVIFQNPNDRESLVTAGGVREEKTRLIRGSGVNLDDYPVQPEPDDTPVVVMASRLLKDKGVLEFVEAARLLRLKGVDAQFQLIGEPDPENPESVTPEILSAWNSEGIVACLGFQSDIAKFFSHAHIVVLPSYREGLPKVLIEAAAAGRAVVTTDMPGCRDAIEPDITGLLVPARDAAALADAIARLLKDDVLRRKMGQSGRHLAKREFGIEKVVATHMQIYRELETNA